MEPLANATKEKGTQETLAKASKDNGRQLEIRVGEELVQEQEETGGQKGVSHSPVVAEAIMLIGSVVEVCGVLASPDVLMGVANRRLVSDELEHVWF